MSWLPAVWALSAPVWSPNCVRAVITSSRAISPTSRTRWASACGPTWKSRSTRAATSASSASSSGSSSAGTVRLRLPLRCRIRALERRGLLRDAVADQRDRHQEHHPPAGASEVPARPLLIVGGLRRLAGADGRDGDGRVRDQTDERLRDDEVGQRDADPQLGDAVRHRVGRRPALQHLRAGRVLQPLSLGELPLPLLRAEGLPCTVFRGHSPHVDLLADTVRTLANISDNSSPARPTTSAASTTTRSRSSPTSCSP